jgi:hypothetical protein
MPILMPEPEKDPDGSELMKSLKLRTQSARHTQDSRALQFRPALFAVNELLLKRRNVGGSLAEMERLETIARDLQALARGF